MDGKQVNRPPAGPISGTFFCALALALWPFAGCEKVEPKPEVDRPPPIEAPGGVEMVAIPGGSFLMGSVREDEPDEIPHQGRLNPFYIDKYEVTQAEYER